MSLRERVLRDQDFDFLLRVHPIESLVGLRSEALDQSKAFLWIGSAIHSPDRDTAQLLPEVNRFGFFWVAEVAIEIAGRILVVGEEEDLSSTEVAAKQVFQTLKLRVLFDTDSLDALPDLG